MRTGHDLDLILIGYTVFPVEMSSGTTVIGLCGGSGSGKSTVAQEAARLLGSERTTIVSFDSYYHDLAHLTPQERAVVNFDAPESLDVDLIIDHVEALRDGQEIAVPIYDFASHTRSADLQLVAATDFVILEGILLFAFPRIRAVLDFLVFLECPVEVRFQRRLRRDVEERGRTPESVEAQWHHTVRPMHDLHVQPHAQHADFVVTHGPPAVELARQVLAGLSLHVDILAAES